MWGGGGGARISVGCLWGVTSRRGAGQGCANMMRHTTHTWGVLSLRQTRPFTRWRAIQARLTDRRMAVARVLRLGNTFFSARGCCVRLRRHGCICTSTGTSHCTSTSTGLSTGCVYLCSTGRARPYLSAFCTIADCWGLKPSDKLRQRWACM